MDQGVLLKLALELERCGLKAIKGTGRKLWRYLPDVLNKL